MKLPFSILCDKQSFRPDSYCPLILFLPIIVIPAIMLQLSKCDRKDFFRLFTRCNLGILLLFILFLIINFIVRSVFQLSWYLSVETLALISSIIYFLLNEMQKQQT
jgi:hypothetical protein